MTREEAKQAIDYYYCHTDLLDEFGDYCDQTEYGKAFDIAIKALSSSEKPNTCEDDIRQQRTGRWIKTRLDDEPDKICDDCGTYCWKCSTCGCDASGWGNFKYCPKCGARMEVE